MALVERLDRLSLVPLESALCCHTPARGRPHIANIKVFLPVTIKITPRGAHPRSNILYTCFRSYVGKGAVAIVAVQVLPSEIISDKQVRPAIVVVISPGTGKAVTVIVLIKAALFGHVFKGTVSSIAVQNVRRTIHGIVIGPGYLSRRDGPTISANVEIQETVIVIIGQCG